MDDMKSLPQSLSSTTTKNIATSAALDSIDYYYSTVGVVISIAGNILVNVALNLQRYAHRTIDYSDGNDRKYLKSRLWWNGAVLMTLGEMGNFLAYGFAPASVVSPLGVFALISNCIIAPCFFNESIELKDIFGVILAIVGVILIIVSIQTGENGNGKDDLPSVTDPYRFVYDALYRIDTFWYVLLSACGVITLIIITRRRNNTTDRITLLCNISLVALLGAYTALSTKCLSSLLSFSFLKSLTHLITYVLIGIIISTAIMQVVFLNKALQDFDATIVVPLHYVFFTVSVIFGSAVVFHDFESRDSFHIIMFFVGCVVTFMGVWLLAFSASHSYISADEENNESVNESLLTPPHSNNNNNNTSADQPSDWKFDENSFVSTSTPSKIPIIETSDYSLHHDNDTPNTPTRGLDRRGSTSEAVAATTTTTTSPTALRSSPNRSSTIPLTNSGFFIGTVLDTRRSRSYQPSNDIIHESHSSHSTHDDYKSLSCSHDSTL